MFSSHADGSLKSRYLASFIGGTTKLSLQNEASKDIAKFLYHCNEHEAEIDYVSHTAKIDSFLSELRRLKVGSRGLVAKLQNIIRGQSFLINKMPDQPCYEEQLLLAKVTLAREKTLAQKKGIAKQKLIYEDAATSTSSSQCPVQSTEVPAKKTNDGPIPDEPRSKRRTLFTSEERDIIKSEFNLTDVTSLPTLQECRDLIKKDHMLFIGRTDKNLQDKAWTIIRSLKKAKQQ